MKRITRLISMILLAALIMSIGATAFAATSSTYKGNSSKTFTVTTGNKAATLTIHAEKGTVSGTAWKNVFKGTTKTLTEKQHAKWYITIKGNGKTVTKTWNPYDALGWWIDFDLAKNTTYKVTVTCKGFQTPISSIKGTVVWDTKWTSSPSVKLKVNNKASIK